MHPGHGMNARNRQHIGRQLALLVCCSAIFIGCDNGEQKEVGASAPDNVRRTFNRLRELHENKAYLEMEKWIEPGAANGVVDLLMAVDQLLAANEAAIETLRETCPRADINRFDLSELANCLGLFSRKIEVVNIRMGNNAATMNVQVADRLPLEQLVFVRYQDRWVYQPGRQLPELTPVIVRLADALNRLTEEMSGRALDREQVAELYRLHIGAKLKEVRELDKPSSSDE
jgi:hypothetical protein